VIVIGPLWSHDCLVVVDWPAVSDSLVVCCLSLVCCVDEYQLNILVVDCDWSVVVEYDDEKEFLAEGVEDIPMVTRKRCNTMPGTFTVADDMSQDVCHIDDGLSCTQCLMLF